MDKYLIQEETLIRARDVTPTRCRLQRTSAKIWNINSNGFISQLVCLRLRRCLIRFIEKVQSRPLINQHNLESILRYCMRSRSRCPR